MNRLDPAGAALYAVVAICLVLIGAVLAVASLTVEQRAAVLGGVFTALAFVVWRTRRTPDG